jgi:hypothetical protein
VNWALLGAGAALVAYQAWAIRVRWVEARELPPAEHRVMLWVLALTRGFGLLLGLVLIGGALLRLG